MTKEERERREAARKMLGVLFKKMGSSERAAYWTTIASLVRTREVMAAKPTERAA